MAESRPSFLPLADSLLSTRSQHLPALIKTRSNASLGADHRVSLTRSASLDRGIGDGSAVPADKVRERKRARGVEDDSDNEGFNESRRSSMGWEALNTPQMRSMRLIGNSNPRYQWHKYYKSEDDLKKMKKPLRQYYERNNFLIAQYLYIDRLLDSSLPHDLVNEYNQLPSRIPSTIAEEPTPSTPTSSHHTSENGSGFATGRVKRTPKTLYRVPDEETPLLAGEDGSPMHDIEMPEDDAVDTNSPVVSLAINVNFVANAILLIGKIAVIVLTSSLSVLASLVDAALDFLSTIIVFTTTRMVGTRDQYQYPVGRSRLEPIGVLVFSIIMITCFAQVALQCVQSLAGTDHKIVQLGIPSIGIMVGTVVIKGLCWFWCRLVNNSSVQALAQDAMTDVIFNIFSIIFPIVGYYAKLWWLDALGGLLLSLYIVINWSRTSASHIRNLSGRTATADERNLLLYLTMRFAKCIKQIQGLQAYHSGDKLNVEVDVVLDESMQLRDSHDLGESLQYMLESVPAVERAFVHLDYRAENLPTHMEQHE